MRKTPLLLALALGGATAAALLWARRDPAPPGATDGCRGCHGAVAGIEAAHAALSCAACHLGDPAAADAVRAHAGLERVPGNLDTAARSCGRGGCHLGEVARVRASPMATARGIVAVDRWAFGEQPTPDGDATIRDLGDSAADTHLRQLCASCHLGRRKERPAPITELSRGGGCVACHLAESGPRDYAPARAGAFLHPRLARTPSDAACFGCHSRSARISLAYQGWWDAGVEDDDEGVARRAAGEWRRLEDGRWVARAEPDVHQARGMACVDCHTAEEVMGQGDGRSHRHEEEATRVRCTTCHRPSTADGGVALQGKLDGRRRVARPPAAACREIAGHARVSCQACHSAWATSCVTCHTRFDPALSRRDGPTGEQRPGAWLEHEGEPRLDAPALGLFTRDGETRVEPVVPGMILKITGPPPGGSPPPLPGGSPRFLRAWALAVPHTTARLARSCDSCHRNPYALGWGRGELSLRGEGRAATFRFRASGPRDPDGLPEDAWIAPWRPAGALATRSVLAPLDREAQLRVLTVGACLTCHDPLAPGGRLLYLSFPEALSHTTPRCRVPHAPQRRRGVDEP